MAAIFTTLVIFIILMLVILLASFKIIKQLIQAKNSLELQAKLKEKEYYKSIINLSQRFDSKIETAKSDFEEKFKLLEINQSANLLSNSSSEIITFVIKEPEYRKDSFHHFQQRFLIPEKIMQLRKHRIAGEFDYRDHNISPEMIKSLIRDQVLEFILNNNFIYSKIEKVDPYTHLVTFYINYYSE